MSAAGVAPAPPVHLNEAAAQRDRLVANYDAQREALLKAVEEQRQAAMAQVRTRQAPTPNLAPNTAASPVMNPALNTAGAAVNPAVAAQLAANPAAQAVSRQQAVIADIVLTLKAMIAEEVRNQLVALMAAADARQKSLTEQKAMAQAQPVPG